MKIVVTGGAGFIGSHIVDLLIKNNLDVIVVDNLSSGKKENINPKAEFYEADIRSDKLEEVFRNNEINSIIHLAAQINANISIAKPIFDADVSIIGSLNLLELARKYEVKKFIFASSAAVYGPTEELPCNESYSINPVNQYGISKYSIEKYLELYSKLYSIECVALRYSNVYGPRQNTLGEAGVMAIFIPNLLKNRSLTVFGNGNQTRDFIYVEDVAQATLQALFKKTRNKVINVSTNEENSINKLIKILSGITNIEVETNNEDPRQGDIEHNRLDNSLAIKELDWKPKTSFEEGLRKTLDFYKQLTTTISV